MKSFIALISLATLFTGCAVSGPEVVTTETHKVVSNATDPAPENTTDSSTTSTTTTTTTTASSTETTPPVARADLPAEVVLEGTFGDDVKETIFQSGQSMLTMLDGGFKITSETPSVGKTYYPMRARTVKFVSPEIGTCRLTQTSLRDLLSGGASGMTLMGSDALNGDGACATFLYAAKVGGIQVEFGDIPVSQSTEAAPLSKLTLKISPAN